MKKLIECESFEELVENYPKMMSSLSEDKGDIDLPRGELAAELARKNPIETILPEEE